MSLARPARATRSLVAIGALLFAIGAGPSIAGATENELFVAIRYTVDDSTRGCWDETEFRRRVAQRIGYDPFRDEAPVSVRAHVGGASNAVDGHVEWRKSNGALMGERRFVAKDGDCRNLLTEMSFSVGLQIELLRPKTASEASTASQSPQDTGGPSPPPSPASSGAEGPSAKDAAVAPRPTPAPKREQAEADARRTPEAPPEEPGTRESSHWPAWVGLGPSLAWRQSPALTGEARLFLGMRASDFSLEVAGEASYPSTQNRWDQSGFRQTLVGASVAACGHQQWLSACGLGRASAVRVTGVGVTKPRSPTGFVAQLGLRVAATIPMGQAWFLAGHVDGLASLNASRVELNDGIMWEMPRLGALAGIDLAVFFR